MSMELTGGRRGDSPRFITVFECIRVPRLALGVRVHVRAAVEDWL
jgi:hypothetical protein